MKRSAADMIKFYYGIEIDRNKAMKSWKHIIWTLEHQQK